MDPIILFYNYLHVYFFLNLLKNLYLYFSFLVICTYYFFISLFCREQLCFAIKNRTFHSASKFLLRFFCSLCDFGA